ncbi:hypothetical protein LCGC14_1002860 [marine sediment metagenome]|uniref:DUF4340 domain-containing protein n=1 Tax=marine sediment metagenome TaxID=412755 RepID=A0A0F9QL07_9ZZZZ
MMTKQRNSLSILFIITVLMVVLMFVTIYRTDDSDDDYGLLFPNLFGQLSEVDNIQFNSAEDHFSLHREGEDWFITQHYDYPANFDEVKRMLIDLSEAKLMEKKTDNPDLYPVLGVAGAPPETPKGQSTEVLLKQGDNVVAGLLLGQQREVTTEAGPKQFYVRRVDDKQSWLAEGYLQISPVMLNWIDGQVIDIARERVARVEIIQPNGNTATLINTGKKDSFGTPQSGDATVFKYHQLGYDIAGSLHQMRLEDVVPKADFERGNVEVVTARFITYDGLVITTRTSFNDGFYFTTLSSEFDPSLVSPAPSDIQALDVIKTAEQVKSESQTLNEKLSPWVYRISGFVGTNLMRAKADIVTEKNNVIPMPPDVSGFGPR